MRVTEAYTIDGERWISVTEALALAGLRDLTHIPHDVLERARERGQAVHEFLELLDLGMVEAGDAKSELSGYVSAYQHFSADAKWQPIHVELVVRCSAYRYAGTLDRVGDLGARRVVLDLKCTSKIDPATALQVAAYQEAFREHPASGREPLGRFALQLRPDGTYRLVEYADGNDWHDFCAALRVAQWQLDHGLARLEDLR